MNKFSYFFLILILGCSLNSDSAFWTKTKKAETDKVITKILFKDVKPNENEFNPKLKVNLPKNNIKNVSHFLNNDGFTNEKIISEIFLNLNLLKLKIFQVMNQKY